MKNDWQAFGATNQPGTCLFCGRKLRCGTREAKPGEEGNPTWKSYGGNYATVRNEMPGSYADGKFCGLRCGYQFGLRLAQLGRRLSGISYRA